MNRSARGRARTALAAARQHPFVIALWFAAVIMLIVATSLSIEPLRAWALLLALLATSIACAAMTNHIITRLTQILGYFHDDVRGSTRDGCSHLRSIK